MNAGSVKEDLKVLDNYENTEENVENYLLKKQKILSKRNMKNFCKKLFKLLMNLCNKKYDGLN